MALNQQRLLECIGSTEETSFKELYQALGDDCPRTGCTAEWAALFREIHAAEASGLIEVDWHNGRVSTLLLTEAGANRVRSRLDSKRGLFNQLDDELEVEV